MASTDPVVLREIVCDGRIPRSVRQVLKFEAGTNDIIVLPAILVLIAVARAQAGGVDRLHGEVAGIGAHHRIRHLRDRGLGDEQD